MPRARVFTIPASAPFLPTFIGALGRGELIPGFPERGNPLSLASATIYLPTRRSCRLARDLFLDTLGTRAAILPRLMPLGDIDEDELIFADSAAPVAETEVKVPPALGALERKLLLAQLVLRWAQSPEMRGAAHVPMVAHTPAAALALADALARLIDDMTTRRVRWEQLQQLVPENVSAYWGLTLDFLKIAHEHWPQILRERGVIETAERRDRLIEAETERLSAGTAGPVIAAGSTASMPATASLLATIARMPNGAVVLPGLDAELDDPSWRLISAAEAEGDGPAAGHAQFGMHAFLAGLQIHREDVVSLAPSAAHGRERLVSEALRPAAATELWGERLRRADFGPALSGMSVVEAANPEEEALAIAVALREVLEEDNKTAALVTPDRGLARRVIAGLERWGVIGEDTAGEALTDTDAGVLARAIVETALNGTPPVSLLALLKHPLVQLGRGEAGRDSAISFLERALLRGPRPNPGTEGLQAALSTFRASQDKLHFSDQRRSLRDFELDAAAQLIAELQAALAPLETMPKGAQPLAEIARRHRDAFSALTSKDGQPSPASPDIDEVLDALGALIESPCAQILPVTADDYPEVLQSAFADRILRKPSAPKARVRIFGLLEARLQHVDRVVLGGLVEGVWPSKTRSDPWLSRPMRRDLGLDLPERRIGLTAHDFAQALGAPEVIISCADKVGGAPTVPSRFVQRLAAVAGEEAWKAARQRGARYLAVARSLDRPAAVQRIAPPQPKPPRLLRPTRLSVTDIEQWLKNPYAIYAEHILKLLPLDPVDTPVGARDRGTAIHSAIDEFTREYADRLTPDAFDDLLSIGAEKFAPLANYPDAKAFWWPRFERMAAWFVNVWEQERRPNLARVCAELKGELEIPLADRTFTLRARADRIEERADGTFALVDYKTGQTPNVNQVHCGAAPQLTLEAAILRNGGFEVLPAGVSVAALTYVQLKGGEPPGLECDLDFLKKHKTSPDSEADAALARLTEVIRKFEDENTPYRSIPPASGATHFGDYDHLSRLKEWSMTAGALE